MDQWYNCPQCGKLIQYGQPQCFNCKGQISWPGAQLLQPVRSFTIGIVGESFNNDDGSNRQEILRDCKPGETIILKHIPHPKDKNAVAVFRANGEQIGYMSKNVSAEFASVLDRKIRQSVEIASIILGNKKLLGCRLKITRYSDDLTWNEKQQLAKNNDSAGFYSNRMAWIMILVIIFAFLASCVICTNQILK